MTPLQSSNTQPIATEEPTCPFCFQQIKANAKTCPHCQKELTNQEHKANDALLLKPTVVDVNCPVEVEAVVVLLEDETEIVADLKINNYTSGKEVINHKMDTVIGINQAQTLLFQLVW